MKIYTGICGGEEKVGKLREYDLGIMISSAFDKRPYKAIKEFSCALDNGAFGSWKLGYPFNEFRFLKTLNDCMKHEIELDFIVIPDIVGGGNRSLEFSKMWMNRLTSNNLAFVVQDGVSWWRINSDILNRISHIFVGGTVQWKWETAENWVKFAHKEGKKCHIGQCGKLEYLRKARDIGADSVDSTSFTSTPKWHVLEEFVNPKQKELI